ncbi:hypothetical protein Hanom_Chr14g01293701 [Helianthus anomalus]
MITRWARWKSELSSAHYKLGLEYLNMLHMVVVYQGVSFRSKHGLAIYPIGPHLKPQLKQAMALKLLKGVSSRPTTGPTIYTQLLPQPNPTQNITYKTKIIVLACTPSLIITPSQVPCVDLGLLGMWLTNNRLSRMHRLAIVGPHLILALVPTSRPSASP